MACPDCDSTNVEIVDDNGADFPETRVEFWECNQCGRHYREVLVA